MKTNPIRIARAAANAADMASVAAAAAENLLMEDPTAWELADNAYWMLKAADQAAYLEKMAQKAGHKISR